MNNPWGDVDEPITISSVIYSIKRWNASSWLPLASYDA
jgi:hypothetical protein